MKPTIREDEAVILITRALFSDTEKHWPRIREILNQTISFHTLQPALDGVNCNQLAFAALGYTLRNLYDIFPNDIAKRLFVKHLQAILKAVGEPTFETVQKHILEYIQLYNQAIIRQSEPVREMSKYLYYLLGYQDIEYQNGAGLRQGPEPKVLDNLAEAIQAFGTRWPVLLHHYRVVS